jgi:Flp pilus assembly pilin Flp
MSKMKNLLLRLWRDEDGAEIAEWVVVVALLVIVAIVIYNGILKGELSTAVESIGSKIDSAAQLTT